MTAMSAAPEVSIRGFDDDDAVGVSALFREVYGACYIYPEIYLPSLIRQCNARAVWRSVVALQQGRVVGHGALLMRHADARQAEIALLAVSPRMVGAQVGIRICRHLCEQASRQGVALLQAMTVSSHVQSQRMALLIGLHTTGVLLDYLPSSLRAGEHESYVLGSRPLVPCPLPEMEVPAACLAWVAPLRQHFGVRAATADEAAGAWPPIELHREGRLVIAIVHVVDEFTLREVEQLPRGRPRQVRLRAGKTLPQALERLAQTGLRHTGLMPGVDGNWYWLMQADFAPGSIQLHCRLAQQIAATALS